MSAAIRPQTLAGFLGQPAAVDQLTVAVQAAKLRGQCLDHALLEGPPGCGKTSMAASVLPLEMNCRCTTVVCSAVAKPTDLLPVLSTQREGDILFLDEIHALPRQLQEVLYPVLEDRRLSIPMPGPDGGMMTISLPAYTIIGATTHEGMLAEPLRDRFKHRIRFRLYDDQAMQAILAFHFANHPDGVSPPGPEVLAYLTRACHGTPRHAVQLVGLCCDDALTTQSPVTLETAQRVFARQGIATNGLHLRERELLRALAAQERPLGLSTLASRLDCAEVTIQTTIEPWLIQTGLINRTPQGRCITPLGRQQLYAPEPITG